MHQPILLLLEPYHHHHHHHHNHHKFHVIICKTVSLFEKSYVYWTMHHLDIWIKRDQLDVTCLIIPLFNAQQLLCWVISWVLLLWYDVFWCYIVVWLGWCGVVSGYHNTPSQPNHNVTPKYIIPELYNPWNNSTNKSQAPEDGCINIRNMLSIKYWNSKASDIKLVSLYSTVWKIFSLWSWMLWELLYNRQVSESSIHYNPYKLLVTDSTIPYYCENDISIYIYIYIRPTLPCHYVCSAFWIRDVNKEGSNMFKSTVLKIHGNKHKCYKFIVKGWGEILNMKAKAK